MHRDPDRPRSPAPEVIAGQLDHARDRGAAAVKIIGIGPHLADCDRGCVYRKP